MTNSLAMVLRTVIRKVGPAGNDTAPLAIYDYSAADDFNTLWTFDGLTSADLVIVWSQIASDTEKSNVNVRPVLTPVDWAICYAKRRERAFAKVLILDLDPSELDRSASGAYFCSLKETELPWLHLETEITLTKVIEWLNKDVTSEQRSSSAAVDRFLRVIRANLLTAGTVKGKDGTISDASSGAAVGTQDFGRHSIANILGPMVLRGQAASRSRHANALLALVRACGMIVPACSGGADKLPAKNDFTLASNYQLILIDDHARQGWSDWVKETVPVAGEANSSIRRVITKAEKVVRLLECAFSRAEREAEELENRGEAKPDVKDLRFKLSFGIARQPIVLLDLRLFGEGIQEECAFYRKHLCPLMEKRFMDRTDLAWPAFRSADPALRRAWEAIHSEKGLEKESEEHHEALTWLPRVLALADMSLPIILFSSTDRKSLTAPLQDYGNVYLGFQKPSIVALGSPFVAEVTADRLREVIINKAIVLGKVRRKCQFIKQRAESVKIDGSGCRELHVELYVDETGTVEETNKSFSVGGVFAIFDNIQSADDFDDACVTHGLRYFYEGRCQPNVQSPLRKKEDDGRRQLERAIRAFPPEKRKDAFEFGYVELRCESGAKPAAGTDGLFHDMLSALVEFFAAESLPAILNQFRTKRENVSLAVYLATRIWPSKKLLNQHLEFPQQYVYQDAKRVQWHWDDGDAMRKPYVRSMSPHDAFPIVWTALKQHPVIAPEQLHRAVAVCLPYYEKGGHPRVQPDRYVHHKLQIVQGEPFHNDGTTHRTDWRADYRALHYVADQILREGKRAKFASCVPYPGGGSAVTGQFITTWDDDSKFCRIASRALDQGQLAVAIEFFPHVGKATRCQKDHPTIAEYLASRMWAELSCCKGDTLLAGTQRQTENVLSLLQVPP